MSNQNNIRAFVEVTALAVMLFAVPIGYYYGRESLLGVQNRIYYKMFGIRQEHLEAFKKRLKEEEAQEAKEEAEEAERQ
jgi:hypothetical protein